MAFQVSKVICASLLSFYFVMYSHQSSVFPCSLSSLSSQLFFFALRCNLEHARGMECCAMSSSLVSTVKAKAFKILSLQCVSSLKGMRRYAALVRFNAAV